MKKLCTFGGCKEIVTHSGDRSSPRCAQHQVVQKYSTRPTYSYHYDDQGRNIYKTPLWKRTRKAKLLLNPLCERCLRFKRSKLAEMVDHILEIKDGGEVYNLSNLQSLCNACHAVKTGQEKRKRNSKSNYPKLSDF